MTANYRGNPNHVRLGINDTPLSSAIEKGDFKTAEKLIDENVSPSYLDEGPFQKTPLTLVLSSHAELRKFPRHLRLAKLLVERGANPNLRIPGVEWMAASRSPMEYVLSLTLYGHSVDPLFTIGLHDETELTLVQLKEQLMELLDVFLACGGNPNVITSMCSSTLYHVILAHSNPNIELVMKLCEAGGDLNQPNAHGTTPLMELITSSDDDVAMDILYNILKKKPDISSLQAQNCANETALWRSMFAGSPIVATELLHQGASHAPRAIIGTTKLFTEVGAVTGVSAMLAPLLQDSLPYVRHGSVYLMSKLEFSRNVYSFHVHLLDKVFSCAISPVVDNTAVSECFPQVVLDEIETIIHEETHFSFDSLQLSAIRPQDVMILMFGKLSAGLQQLCVRQIIDHIFFTTDLCKSMELIAKLKGKKLIVQKEKKIPENWDENEKKDSDEAGSSENIVVEDVENITQWDVVMEFDKTAMIKLVQELLNLPPSLISRFEIEATRLQLGAILHNFETVDCVRGCDGQSDESFSEPFAEDEYDDDDDDDIDDDESSWFVRFITTDDDDFKSPDTEGESGEDDSSFDSSDDYDDDIENDNVDLLFIDENLDVTNDMRLDVESIADEGIMKDAELFTLPSVSGGDGFEKGVAVAEDNSSGSGECVPESIQRDKYEALSDDPSCDDAVSLEDVSHPANSMNTEN
ncbi:uncharacterized protein LOC110835799 isoform X2 [Zootermopsis nevadensis]|uniref:uncharacterized protein LOC110835799 isoform X2 n=1 Tax=Zootermopsis nevadensis TaxID=136037 RepID=UPI000B8ED4B4|nr:uncharacterized protein LOC110835799 isoform X2 [Zootermopsis nevadensis]